MTKVKLKVRYYSTKPIAIMKMTSHSVGFYDKFPTPRLLREAMEEYKSIRLEPPLDATGKPLPYPALTSKREIIDREAIETIDAHALGVRTTPASILK